MTSLLNLVMGVSKVKYEQAHTHAFCLQIYNFQKICFVESTKVGIWTFCRIVLKTTFILFPVEYSLMIVTYPLFASYPFWLHFSNFSPLVNHVKIPIATLQN